MIDEIEDVTHRTTGSVAYEGTVRFSAEGNTYGSQSWLLRADDEQSARATLAGLADESVYADPRIDHLRDLEIEACDETQITDHASA